MQAIMLRCILAIGVCASLSGCGVRDIDTGGGSGDSAGTNSSLNSAANSLFGQRPRASSCELEDINTWVHESMLDYYLFYDQVDRNIDAQSYASTEQLIKDLRVAPNDTFSNVTDEAQYNAFFSEGESFGYGWNFARNEANELLFSLIEPNSPLALANVNRGDRLVSINGLDITQFVDLTSEEQADILGEGDEVKTLELVIAPFNSLQQEAANAQNDAVRQVSVTKATYALQTVLDTKVTDNNGQKTGYLSFYQFVNTSSDELAAAFADFKSAGISELILDLRFNGGGRISVANELASYILGNGHSSDVFTTFAYNDKYEFRNLSIPFRDTLQGLSLNRLFVLQSANTCSASELVVNSLRPFIEVITVGSTSCGKPYATSPNISCGKVSNVLEINLLNAANTGDYFDGIAADCPVQENVQSVLGETSDPLFSTALEYINTGNCSSLAARSLHPGYRLSPTLKQPWQSDGVM